jgi:TrmH family RNA methyltransferase
VSASSERHERFHSARRDPRLCVLEGLHAIKHALRFDAPIEEVVTRDATELAQLATELAPDVAARMLELATAVPQAEYDALAPLSHPTGVMAIAQRRVWAAQDILTAQEAPVIFLEEPVHLGNVGAVVRVAAAAGAAGVLCSGRHDPWSPESVRAAAGLHYAVPVARVEGPPACPGRLVAFDADAPALGTVDLPASAVFAFGSERRGLSDELLARADMRASLPMRDGVSSLNLATAVAAVLYTLRATHSR